MSEERVRAASAVILVAVLSGFLMWDFPSSYNSSSLLVLGLTAVALECLSPKLPGWGYQSCATGCYFLMLMSEGVGPALAQVVALNALLIRTALRGASHQKGQLWDFLGDALPLTLSLALLKLLQPFPLTWLLLVALYAALTILSLYIQPLAVPGHLLQSKKSLAPFLVGMGVLGLYWPLQSSHVLPGLLMYGMMVYGAWELSRTRTVSREELAQTHLGLVRDYQDELYEEIAKKSSLARHQARNRKLLEAIQKNFLQANSPKHALSQLLKLTDGLFKPRSTVLFLYREGALHPYLFRSPDTKELEGAELTDLREPLVESCWRENRPMSRRKPHWPAKLLPEERSVAAAPIPGYGVLYLGHSQKLFDATTLETLSLIGRQASYLLQTVTQKADQQQKIAFVSDEKRRLTQWLNRLEQLLDISRRLSSCQSPREVYQALEERFSELIPHHYFAAIGDGNHPLVYTDNNKAPWKTDGLKHLVRRLVQNPRPLLLNSFPQADIVPLEGASALLLVPMNRLKTALLLIECRDVGSYTEEHLDLVRMLGQLAESALLRMQLQQEYLSASKAAAIGQMAAGLSHELNTPLGAMQLEMEMAQVSLERSPEKAERHLQRAENALDTAQKILSALLYYTTSYAVSHDQLNLREVVQEAVQSLRHDWVECTFQGDNFQLQAYRLDLDQLLKQLLYNAVEAAESQPQPRVQVTVSERGDNLGVEIRDNGPGISEEIRERIFEPFFTTKPVGRGLGLGLAVASQIARLHGGQVSLLSTSPKGSSFALRLPRSPEPPEHLSK